MMHGVYTVALGAALLAAAPSALYRRVTRRVPLRLRERLGRMISFAPGRALSQVLEWKLSEDKATATMQTFPAESCSRDTEIQVLVVSIRSIILRSFLRAMF